jgi:putative nucleotidyltransferase with HDIG domain
VASHAQRVTAKPLALVAPRRLPAGSMRNKWQYFRSAPYGTSPLLGEYAHNLKLSSIHSRLHVRKISIYRHEAKGRSLAGRGDMAATSVWTERRTEQESGRVGLRVLPQSIPQSEIISALSYALDLTEGQPMGHSVRSCFIGMRIGEQIGLPAAQLSDLYYSLLLKDAGCSSNSSRLFHILNTDEIRAKRDVKTTDWTRVGWESLHYALTHVATGAPFLERMQRLFQVAATQQQDSCDLVKIRCERGAHIAKQLGFSDAVASGIHSLDEHWNGRGYPDGLRHEAIPLSSRITNLSQTLDVFLTAGGSGAAIQAAERRSGRWFDPDLVRAAVSLSKNGDLWAGLEDPDLIEKVQTLEPEQRRTRANEDAVDNICVAFAEVIDAKSPFTYRHSSGVADAALEIARWLGMSARQMKLLRRSALLHDVGKLSVPNSILEKPAKLTSEEWKVVRDHPYYTLEILKRIPGFEGLSDDAAAHHERLDGSGYWRGFQAGQLSLSARILAVADVFDALHAKRPYRDSLPIEKVFAIMREDAPRALDAQCLEALIAAKTDSDSPVLA